MLISELKAPDVESNVIVECPALGEHSLWLAMWEVLATVPCGTDPDREALLLKAVRFLNAEEHDVSYLALEGEAFRAVEPMVSKLESSEIIMADGMYCGISACVVQPELFFSSTGKVFAAGVRVTGAMRAICDPNDLEGEARHLLRKGLETLAADLDGVDVPEVGAESAVAFRVGG